MWRPWFRRGIAPAVLAALAAAGQARDWPQWGGADQRNMVSPETDLPASFYPGRWTPGGGIDPNTVRNVRWIAPLGSATYASPIVAGGRVIIGTNDGSWSDPRAPRTSGGVLACFEERTGRLLWRLLVPRYEQKVYGSEFDDLNTGVCSSPTAEGERLYVVTNRAEVLCLDAQGLANGNDGPFRDEGRYMAPAGRQPVELRAGDADILWRFDMISELPCAPHDAASCGVLIHGDLLYVGTGNGVHRIPKVPNPLPDAPSLIALDKKTGRLVAVDDEKIGRRVFHGQWSSPSLGRAGGRTLIFYGGGDGVCYAFQPASAQADANAPAKLRKVWWYDCNPHELRSPQGKPADYWAGDASRAKVRKDFKGPSEIIATPVFHNGRVYVAVGRDPMHGEASGILHCIEAAGTGNITKTGCAWSYRNISRSMSTVAVAGGLLYATDLAGVLHCLDADSGKVCWVHDTRQPIWSSPLVADGKVYVGTQRKYLWVFRAGRSKKLLAKVRLPRAMSTTPVAANGVLYVATHRHLYAVVREAAEAPRPTSVPEQRP
jgi:outer membrane protein assembly factor BamB